MVRIKGLILALIFTITASSAFCQQEKLTGLKLCNQLYNQLRENNFKPETQNLIANSENDFPFNIYSVAEGSLSSSENLILVFSQEKAAENFDLVRKLFSFIKSQKYSFNTYFLFAYGEEQEIPIEDAIYGNRIFINSLEPDENFTAILINPGAENNHVYAANEGKISPSWLVQSCFNRLVENHINIKTGIFYLSQLSSFYFIKDRQLDTFFNSSIPAIKLDIKRDTPSENLTACLFSIISDFDRNLLSDWEQNFLMFNFLGHYSLISETMMVFIIIGLFFFIFLFLFVLGYINSFIKNDNWKKIRYVWWIVPVTFVLIIAGFFAGKLFSLADFSDQIYVKIYFLLFWQLTLSVLFVTIFYNILMVFNIKIEERSVDFMILISTFVNQSLFSIYDISVFPVLFLIFIAAFLTLFFKNIFSHGFLFVVIILILVSYVHTFITGAEGNTLYSYFSSTTGYIYSFAMISTPIFLLYLRIFIKFSTKHPLYKQLFAFSAVFFGLIILVQAAVCFKEIPALSKNSLKKSRDIITSRTISDISLDVKDTFIFDDLIRTITVNTKRDCLLCQVEVLCSEAVPVQYSENEYIQKNSSLASFKIPWCPPEVMKFTYGTTKSPCKIRVSEIYRAKAADNYILEEKTFDIGEQK